ncbi:hypothetical protein [Aquimarina rhabdastrellae]
MLQNLLSSEGITSLNKKEQKQINGGFNNPACANAISLDGTLCLCRDWRPQNGVCVYYPR